MNTISKDLKDVIDSVKAYIELDRASGINEFFVNKPNTQYAIHNTNDLDVLKKEISSCKRCPLYKTRRNIVFGAGNPKAELMFVGEAPGADEDLQGLPFVGRAGQLLTKIIGAMGLTRSDVYIANILKCRPPNNRPPLPAEIAECEGILKRQIDIIKPKVICTLGKFASQTLLRTETTISALRGNFREYNGIKLIPTFHPAYLLRNPNDKKLVWQDMKKIMKELKLKCPSSPKSQ
ncbi:MAG: uracil-DNA glycosylase [Candidatus Omnitrophota bacterium]|jgi:DNA polymerase|nr:uracil-DNA glycosylase [Candidatus Omnitrophota bacterium]